MKRILTWAICLGLASTMAVQAKDHDKKQDKQEKKAQKAQAKAAKQQANLNRHHGSGGVHSSQQAVLSPNVGVSVAPGVGAEISGPTVAVNRNRTITRRGPSNYSWDYNEARRYHNRGVRRDRSWYTSRYNRFSLFAGGYYYFDRGYWYPAYGYDPAYSSYRFDEPIYGYNSFDPQRVITNVQIELRRQGYYRGSIDGMIGPMTRAAVARYQRNNGLYVTRAIDGPTLAALGLS